MKILLTNDDGPHVAGLSEFAAALGALGEVTVVVPEVCRSGVGHSMSLSEPLRVHRSEEGFYLASGYPSDCVKYACMRLFEAPPDLVVSGINTGENTGVSVFYSGTVAGAREGALNGITSIAVSVGYECDPAAEPIVNTTVDVVKGILDGGWPAGSLFNVNIPSLKPKGIRPAPQGRGAFMEELVESTDPRKRDYYWFSGTQNVDGETDTDVVLYREGYVTITPLSCDETNGELLKRMAAFRWVESV